MKCPQCGHDNPTGAAVCASCGLIFGARVQPGPAAQRVVCPNCRTTSSPANPYCNRCQLLLPVLDGSVYAGTFRIGRMVGQGGMGRVYRAEHLSSRRPAAIKEMVDERGWPDSERARYVTAFQREVDLLRYLHQLRTVPELLAPCAEWNGRRYFVMEFIEGKSLQRALEERGGPFPPDVVVEWTVELCKLLEVLHRQQPNPIVHQDLKPENIFLRPPPTAGIVLLDFGVARFVRVGTKLSVYAGTPGFAPKEQIQDRRPEPRSDLYSLAVCMHQFLTGRDPTQNPPPFPAAAQLNPQVHGWLSDLIAINLSEEPRERYESAARLREDLVNQCVTATLRCPACGTENERSLVYCKNCTRTLSTTSRQCRHCGQFIPNNSLYCPWCGKEG